VSALPRIRITLQRAPAGSLASYTLLSLGVHAFAIGLVAAGVAWMPARKQPLPDPGFFVRLADLPPAGGGTARVPEQPLPSPVPPEAPKAAAPKETPKKESPNKEVVLPERHRDDRPSPKKPVVGGTGKEETAPAASGTGGTPGTAGPGVPGGIPGGEGASLQIPDFAYGWYTALLLTRLKAVWRPPLLPPEATRSVTVSFVIHRDGSVDQVQVEVPSNYEPLNTSAIRAVYDAAPLPALPRQERRESLSARMVFEPQPQDH